MISIRAGSAGNLSRPRLTAIIVVLIAIALGVLQFHREPRAFLHAWLFAWWFVVGIPLGSLVLQMIHNLTGGDWGWRIRAPLEAAEDTLPLALLLSLPLWAGLPDLYPWAAAKLPISHPEQAWYLNRTGFALREAICFGAWIVLSRALRRVSAEAFASRHAAARDDRRLRALSAAGLIVYTVTITIAAVDWIMSLTPEWTSTSFGLLAAVGQALAAFALALACAALVRGVSAVNAPVARNSVDAAAASAARHAAEGLDLDIFHDLGNLLLTFVMLWAYLAYTQYLIIWAEDLPREIAWYLPRVQTSWRWLGIALVAGQFAIPFAALLSREAKRSPPVLGSIAALVLAAHLADVFWLVAPSEAPDGFAITFNDIVALIGCGGAWLLWLVRGWNRTSRQSGVRDRTETGIVARHG